MILWATVLGVSVNCNVPFCRAFEDPSPAYRLVADSVRNFFTEVHSFSIGFRIDVFDFLFEGRGSVPPSGRGDFF